MCKAKFTLYSVQERKNKQIPVGKLFSAFDPTLVIKEQGAAVKHQPTGIFLF